MVIYLQSGRPSLAQESQRECHGYLVSGRPSLAQESQKECHGYL